MAQTDTALSIGQVAERTRLSVHALRFYEREGILATRVARASGGRRIYTEQDIEWLNLCIVLRASGMPIPEIRRYAEYVRSGPGNNEERLDLMRTHRDRVAAQIAELTRCMELIDFKVAVYEDLVSQGITGGSCDVVVPTDG
jgi:DNA-binding transcriptional MerR regulator